MGGNDEMAVSFGDFGSPLFGQTEKRGKFPGRGSFRFVDRRRDFGDGRCCDVVGCPEGGADRQHGRFGRIGAVGGNVGVGINEIKKMIFLNFITFILSQLMVSGAN